MIKPTVGRVLLVFAAAVASASGAVQRQAQPWPALVTQVNDEDTDDTVAGTVNVAGFTGNGQHFAYQNLRLVQEGEDIPALDAYATWMPYQIEQAKKDLAPAAPL